MAPPPPPAEPYPAAPAASLQPWVPPGWYPVPWRQAPYRFWSGHSWTPGLSGGYPPAPYPPAPLRSPDTRVDLPKRALFLALGGIVVGLVLSLIGGVAGELVAPHGKLLALLLGQAGLWAGLLGAVWLASKRYGSGNPCRDFGVRFRGADAGWGTLASIGARVGGTIVLTVLVMANPAFRGSNTNQLTTARGQPLLLLVLAGIAIVGAPFVEELFFRGLLQRSLRPLAGAAGAIGGQAVIFASLHMKPSYGLGNVSVFAAIAVFGVIQGWLADQFRRLGPGMVSHALFNLVAVLVVASQ